MRSVSVPIVWKLSKKIVDRTCKPGTMASNIIGVTKLKWDTEDLAPNSRAVLWNNSDALQTLYFTQNHSEKFCFWDQRSLQIRKFQVQRTTHWNTTVTTPICKDCANQYCASCDCDNNSQANKQDLLKIMVASLSPKE